MKCGVHTIRSGWTASVNPTFPRRYSMDNGDFELNMKLTDLEIFPIGNDETAGQQDKVSSDTVFFVVATSSAGATPTSSTASPSEYGVDFNLRPNDSRQIAWGIASPAFGYVYTHIDENHIIPEDLYVAAWSISPGGGLVPAAFNLGYCMVFEQKKSSGSEALLYQVKESASE